MDFGALCRATSDCTCSVTEGISHTHASICYAPSRCSAYHCLPHCALGPLGVPRA